MKKFHLVLFWNLFHAGNGPQATHTMDCMFLLVVQVYSKKLEVTPMRTTASFRRNVELRTLFAINGIPAQLLSEHLERIERTCALEKYYA